MNTKLLLAAAALAVLTVGCKKEPAAAPPPPAPVEEPAPAPKKIIAQQKTAHVRITKDHLEIDQKIHFGLDSEVIQDDSNELLNEIATVLKEHSEIATLHVIGHTDKSGSAAHNKSLSERRAAAVVKALRDRGVETTIDSKGAGKDKPICTDDTDECHEKNRRVEFVIEKKEG